ncbi:MAG TPA: hypothetical protein VF307_06915 [Candidatus Nanopelagicaceae bacterium]
MNLTGFAGPVIGYVVAYLMGEVNFANSTNLIITAASLIIGISDMSWTRGEYTFTGIVNATLVAVIGYQALHSIGKSRGNSK